MAFTKLTKTQNEFLTTFLKGTGRKLSADQANSQFGIKNLRARCTELRQAGLKVETAVNTRGKTTYQIIG